MDLKELKLNIKNNNLDDSLLIFKYSDNSFIAKQYIDEIAKIKKLNKKYVDDLSNDLILSNNIFGVEDDNLNILNIDKLETKFRDFNSLKNTIVVCKDIDKALIELVNQNIVDFSKPEEWQVVDYMKASCPGLNEKEISWLYSITKGDINRIDNELNKINVFSRENQEQVFIDLSNNGGYQDLNSLTIFNLTNAIMKKDMKTIKDIISDLDNIDVEGTGLVTILHKNIKNLINIQMNPKATPESLNMSIKQFKAISYNCGKFSNLQLINMMKFLTSIDYRLKSGLLEITNNRLVDYIICNIID